MFRALEVTQKFCISILVKSNIIVIEDYPLTKWYYINSVCNWFACFFKLKTKNYKSKIQQLQSTTRTCKLINQWPNKYLHTFSKYGVYGPK